MFIYCKEERVKELKTKGLTFLHTTKLNNETMYVFANNNNLSFDESDGLFFIDKLNF